MHIARVRLVPAAPGVEAKAGEAVTSRTLQRLHTRFRQREAVGTLKYGTTVDRIDLTPLQWLIHAQEEAMDLCLYLERLREHMGDEAREE